MKKTSPVYVIGFMIVISAICGTAVSFVHFSMQKTLEANERLSRNRTIAKAFGISVSKQTADGYDTAIAGAIERTSFSGDNRTWELFTRKAAPHDIGFIFTGIAFWDRVSGILVLSNDFSTIRSLEIIEQKETPGLGARIEEEGFKQQFQGYPLNWDESKQITFGKPDATDGSHRVDAITGATQTSMALERIINSELAAFKTAYDSREMADSSSATGRRFN
ncbi:MAG: FMN-binding protein [Chitinispirillaceae bacterium]|nr:FMN-binding protein [Chitinispirillaceae bacterium]